MIEFIGTSFTISLKRCRYSTHFQFVVAHALGFSVFTSRLLATDLNRETSTLDQYEAFFLYRLQSLCIPLF
jgi:hypothetical protein